MKNFDWEKFKEGNIAVSCKTKEIALDFFTNCKSHEIREWVDGDEITEDTCWGKYESETCYTYNKYGLSYAEKDYYKQHGYGNINWKLDYDYNKEYNIQEVFMFPEGTEFISVDKYENKYKIIGEDLHYESKIYPNWFISEATLQWKLNAKFKLIPQDKEVTFLEAIQAYGKTIYCKTKFGREELIMTFKNNSLHSQLKDTTDNDTLSPNEILHGKWFIKGE